jgi:hypothetical protein
MQGTPRPQISKTIQCVPQCLQLSIQVHPTQTNARMNRHLLLHIIYMNLLLHPTYLWGGISRSLRDMADAVFVDGLNNWVRGQTAIT